jgi:branched-chain amino acid transport system substrate-binding protein
MRIGFRRRGSRRAAGVALVTLLALAVAVVATTGAGAAKPKPKAPAKTGPVLNYAKYVGGKGKANQSLSPVVIGWINGQGGTVPGTSFPSTTRGIEAAVKMVNNELGGVHGHPVKLDECFIVSAEEEGTKCGQQMANDSAVKVVLHGVVVTGNQSEYNVLKGSKPVVMGVSANDVDAKAKNVYALIGTSNSVLGSFGPYAKKIWPKTKTAAVVYPNSAGSDVAAKNLQKSMQSVGIKATLIAHSPTASDLVGTATQANGYDLVVASCNFSDCALLAKGLAAIGSTKPVLTPPLVTFIPPSQFPGGDYPKWDVGVAQAFIFNPADPEIRAFQVKANQYGLSKADQSDAFAQLSWTTILATVKIMNSIPFNKLTSAAINNAFQTFTGPLVMASPHVACGKIDPTQPAACADEAQFYRYQGGGKWAQTSSWLGPAKKG